MRKLALVVIGSFILTVLAIRCAFADPGLPAQAQASALAVPESSLTYASAILVVRCRVVEALILIDNHGEQHPYHGKDNTIAGVLTILSVVPADKVMQVTLSCPTEQST